MESIQQSHQRQPSMPPKSHPGLASALEQLGTAVVCPRGTILFQQGQQPTGVFVLRKGKVQLSRSEDGLRIQRTVGPGHVLGLLATVSDQPYIKTAKSVDDCEYVSVDRNSVMNLLHRRNDFWLEAVTVLADEVKLIRKRISNSKRKKDAA
jgi:CRP-like cAMP-binding protein